MKSSYEFLRELILPIDEINNAIPKSGKIIDFGCGQGQIAYFLSRQLNRQVIGIDANYKRLPKYTQKNLTFKKADITKLSIEKINGAVLSDVLHHLSLKNQNKLLEKIYKNLEKNGVLIIKEIDTGEFIRSNLSRLWDFILYPRDKIVFSNSNYLKKILINFGFEVTISRPCRYFPGSTTLYICTKK
jgi:2-polyprenyl-3-methyl-5-hydroxy-6-metoxy-1,4-benzoquinol methylase